MVQNLKMKNKQLEEKIQALEQELRDRKLAEISLRQSQQLLETIYDHTHIMIAFLDTNFNFIRVNRAYAEADERESSFFIGKNHFDLYPNEENKKIFQAVVKTGNAHFEFAKPFEYVEHPERGVSYWDWHLAPVRDSQGNMIGLILTLLNVTERIQIQEKLKHYTKELEQGISDRTKELNERIAESEQLNRALANLLEDLQAANHLQEKTTKRLKEANEELESFSYSVSHDLRSPLRAIDGFSEILLREFSEKLEDEPKRLLNIICQNAEKMRQLIDDLLKFSRTSRKQIRLTQINMEALVKEVIDELTGSEKDRSIKFVTKELKPASADKSMIQIVLSNLVSNAVKFTRPKKKAVVEIGCLKEKKETVYYVRDNGVGFNEKYADKLFGVFQRLHSDKEFEGTGIGLGLVQRIIYKHGGKVWGEAEIDKRATFYFSLPLN